MDIIIKEIKARSKNPDWIEAYLNEKGAKFIGLDHQIDTYFNVAKGRLKLREGNIKCNLIQYNRTEVKEVKNSEVLLFKVEHDAKSLKKLLIKANGITAIVDKKRKIYFIDNVKFHIDEVKHLGAFIEIEAIGEKGITDQLKLENQCRFYMNELNVLEEDLIDKSYSDLIMTSKNS